MVKSPQLFVAAAVFLTLVLQVTDAETVVFNLEKKIEEYAQWLAHQHDTKVVWWDTHGEKLYHPTKESPVNRISLRLGESVRTQLRKRYKLDIKTGPVFYSDVSSTRNKSTVLCTKWVEAASGPVQTIIEKSKTYIRKSSWSSQRSIRSGYEVSLTLGLPNGWGGFGKRYRDMNLTTGIAGEYTESETLSTRQVVTTSPMTSTKIEWIVIDEVQEIPWYAEVTVEGWFAVCLDKVGNSDGYVHFPKITAINDRLLKIINDKKVLFTVRGVFTGVKKLGDWLKVRDYDRDAYNRQNFIDDCG